jgi:iron complex outermembrane recepter protein
MSKFFKRQALLSAASALALAGAAQAQQTPPADPVLQEIIVTGFRKSLEDAIAIKKNADTLVESVTAEDIGRLPDLSIAESLARLPGIASQRTNGQSSAINIRGLSQNFTLATLNGRELVTPNGNRSVEFDQYPSELLAGADIYKSPKASLIEGGLAGIVDLKTIRPLNLKETRVVLNARGSYSDRGDEIADTTSRGYRVSGSYIGQFADDTVGVALGYTRLSSPDISVRFVGFDYAGASKDFNGDGVNDNPSFGFETEQKGGRNIRDGFYGNLQWEPTENLTWNFDSYYSKFKRTGYGRGIRLVGPQEVNGTNTTVRQPVVSGQALIGGIFSRSVPAPTQPNGGFGLTTQVFNDNQFDEDKLLTLGSDVEYTSDRWTLKGDFTYSRADSFFANEGSNSLKLASLTGGVPGVTNNAPTTPLLDTNITVGYQLRGVRLPTVNFLQDFVEPGKIHLSNFGVFPYDNEDRLYAFRGDAKYDVDGDFIKSLELGARYSSRDASQRRVSANFGHNEGFFQFASRVLVPIALDDSNSKEQCFQGAFARAGFPCFRVVRDPRALVEAQIGGPIVTDQSQEFTRSESYTISEDVWSGYGMVNIDTELSGLPVTGNVGLRVVHTKQDSKNVFLLERIGLRLPGTKYTDYLPSANLVFRATDNDLIRFSAARALSRAPLGNLGSGLGVGFDTGRNVISGGGRGNPSLEPYKANQADLAYEHYFNDNKGIFTTALFYKDITSYIRNITVTNFNFEAAGLLPLLSAADRARFEAAGGNPVGRFSGNVNTDGGYVYGLEMAATATATFLPAPWDGLGTTFNYGYTKSEINFADRRSGQELVLPLPGLSKHVFNATFFYDYEGFSNRISGRYRSRFISPQTGIEEQLPYTNSEFTMDYQASYKFPDGSPFQGLTVLFQINNLNDEPVRTYFGREAQTGTLQYFGRQFLLGVTYTY